MLYAVTIAPLNVICFVTDRPDNNPWEDTEEVELDINPLFGTWTPDLGPLHQTLCVSASDPKHYKVFMHSKDIGIQEFRPTGRRFGGLFSKAAWERYAQACRLASSRSSAEGTTIRSARPKRRSPRSNEEAKGGSDHRA